MPRGPRGGLSAPAPWSPAADRPVQAPRSAGHLRPRRASPSVRGKLRPAPGHPAQHLSSPRAARRPAVRPPASEGGGARGPRAPSPGPPARRPSRPPLTTETWRPGPVAAERSARVAALSAAAPDGGGQAGTGAGTRAGGGRGRRSGRAPAVTFLFPAAGGGAWRGGGGPGALTPSAPPALHPLGRAPGPAHRDREGVAHCSEAEPEVPERVQPPKVTWPEPEWPSRDFGAHEGHPHPRGRSFPRGGSLGVARRFWMAPGHHPPPSSPDAPRPRHFPRTPMRLFLGGGGRGRRVPFSPPLPSALSPLPLPRQAPPPSSCWGPSGQLPRAGSAGKRDWAGRAKPTGEEAGRRLGSLCRGPSSGSFLCASPAWAPPPPSLGSLLPLRAPTKGRPVCPA